MARRIKLDNAESKPGRERRNVEGIQSIGINVWWKGRSERIERKDLGKMIFHKRGWKLVNRRRNSLKIRNYGED